MSFGQLRGVAANVDANQTPKQVLIQGKTTSKRRKHLPVPMTRVHTASAQPAAVNASLPTQTPLQQTCQEIHTYDTIPTWGYTGLQQDFNKESTSSNSSRTMSTDLLRRKKPFVRASANTAQTRPCWSTTTQLQTSAGVVYIHTMSAHGVNRHFVSADTVNNAHIQQHEQARHQRYRMDSKQLRANTMRLRIPQPLRSNLQGPNWNLAKVGSASMTRSTCATWWYVTADLQHITWNKKRTQHLQVG